MGIGTFLVGVAVGAGGLFFLMNREALGEIEVPGPAPVVLDEVVAINVQTDQISSERWEFEATYRNRTNRELRSRLIFELRDPQNGLVFSQSQDVNLQPESTTLVFWDTTDISQFTPLEGDFVAEFRVEELFTANQFARPFTVIVPIVFVSPMTIEAMSQESLQFQGFPQEEIPVLVPEPLFARQY